MHDPDCRLGLCDSRARQLRPVQLDDRDVTTEIGQSPRRIQTSHF